MNKKKKLFLKGIFYYRISKKSLRISIYIEATKIKKKLDNRNNRKIMLQKKKKKNTQGKTSDKHFSIFYTNFSKILQ